MLAHMLGEPWPFMMQSAMQTFVARSASVSLGHGIRGRQGSGFSLGPFVRSRKRVQA